MRHHPWFWVAAGFVLTLIAGSLYITRVNSTHPAPWPMTGGQANRRYGAAVSLPAAEPKTLFAMRLDDGVQGSPVIWQDDTVYVASGSKVVAVGPDGKRRWAWDSQATIGSLALGRHGTVYAHTGTMLYALNPDGTPAWQVQADTGAPFPLLVGQGGVVYASGQRMIFAVDSDGRVNWRFRTTSGFIGSPLAEGPDGRLYFMINTELYALNHKGDTVWHDSMPPAYQEYSVAVGDRGRIYVKGSHLTIVNPDGTLAGDWGSTEAGSLNLAVHSTYMQDGYFRVTPAGNQHSLPGQRNERLASVTLALVDKNGKSLVADYGFAGDMAARSVSAPILQLVGSDGQPLRTFGRARTDPTQPYLRLYSASGTELWTYDELSPISPPAVGDDGRICFGVFAESYGLVCLAGK